MTIRHRAFEASFPRRRGAGPLADRLLPAGLVLLAAAPALAGATRPGDAPPAVVRGTIPPDWPAATPVPVPVPLPPGLDTPENLQAEVTIEAGPAARTMRRVIAQVEPDPAGGAPRAWLLMAVEEKERGRPVAVSFAPADKTPAPPARARDNDPELTVSSPGGSVVLKYWHGPPKPSAPQPVTDYIHPLVGLDGEVLTDVFPKDHLHHRGVFWAWVRHEQNGKPLGQWWVPRGVRCEPGPIRNADGPVFARFESSHWLGTLPKSGSSGQRFLRHDVVCRVYPETPAGRAIDLDLTVAALVDGLSIGGTLTLDKGYGGLTVRFAPARQTAIVADGQTLEADGVRRRARWADFSGIFTGPDGRPLPHRSGLAVLTPPNHPDAPPAWLMRLYGVLNVSYPGLDMAPIPRDRPLRLSYRLWIHRGDARQGAVEAHCRAYGADWKWQGVDTTGR